jgi:predicted RNA-binding Zn ribbon-like protein
MDSIALELANTLTTEHGQVEDTLPAGRVDAWLQGHRVRISPGDDAARPVLEMRAALRELLAAAASGGTPPAAALDALNVASAAVPEAVQLNWPGSGQRRSWSAAAPADPTATVLAIIARSAIDLLTGPDSDRIRACAAPGCPRFLIARPASRIWCSGSTCGNRVRVARHAAARRESRPGNH